MSHDFREVVSTAGVAIGVVGTFWLVGDIISERYNTRVVREQMPISESIKEIRIDDTGYTYPIVAREMTRDFRECVTVDIGYPYRKNLLKVCQLE
jgi:hypothetical protein